MYSRFKLHLLFVLISLFSLVTFGQELRVTLPFTAVNQNGGFVGDLKVSDLQVFQNKNLLKPIALEKKSDLPLEVVILIDVSASQERTLPAEKIAAELFINSILKKDKDKVSIVKFTGKMTIVQNLTNDFEKAKSQLKKIQFEPPEGYIGGGIVIGNPPVNKTQAAKGSTSIWDSINESVSIEFKNRDQKSRQVVLLISDGVNNYGNMKLNDVISNSIKNRVLVYAIGIGDKDYDGVDEKSLKKITRSTGGELILPKKTVGELLEQITLIENGLRSFYELSVEVNSVDKKESLKESEIKIINSEINQKNVRLLQPEGFFIQ